ncbi:hypothetical protein CKAN_01417200 [Cinnamomum micranthum f. kanehirae]|uniref:Uncharacterized protein n=1 Tax=Cinnamomum micranthum f. kanehirae TaxID=337451 RepID=A0A3S3MSI8_9MAGN|nr:hypothetical protein CKAN_01417200 [Cinnamomum micranthum f. kanehirae]
MIQINESDLEEVERHRRHFLVPKPWVPEQIQTSKHTNHLKRRHIKHNRQTQSKEDKNTRRTWVPPVQQRQSPLPLHRQIPRHRLHPPHHAPQPVVPHPHNIRRPRGRKSIKLLVQLVRVRPLGVRQHYVHVRRVPRPEPIVPYPNQEQIQEQCRQNQFRITNQYEKQDVD